MSNILKRPIIRPKDAIVRNQQNVRENYAEYRINRIIDGFNESRFLVYFIYLYTHRVKKCKENIALTLQHLQGQFFLFIFALLLDFIVLVGELIKGKYG